MFIKTENFMGKLSKIDYFSKVDTGNHFCLCATIGEECLTILAKESETEVDDFMEALADAIENGQEVFRE